jgi:hypothetical protein
VADIYGNIPDVDSRGIAGQIGKFKQWNPNPIGNEAANLGKINPDLARVIAQARADNPKLNFVLGSGIRTAQQQDLAHNWGWSPIGAKGGGDAAVHMQGNAADLWPLDDQGRVNFDPGQQKAVSDAMKAAAAKLNVNLTAGGDWKHPDQPHFEMTGNPTWTPSSSSSTSSAQPTPGTTLNSNAAPQPAAAADGDILTRLKAGIAQKESGGNYSALGPVTKSGDRAYGKYQVMGANVGPWTQAALGHELTPEQFRNDPQAQEAVANYQLGNYIKQYGPQGAAAMWFSGSPNTTSSAKDVLGTSVSKYVQDTAGTLGRSPTGSTAVASAAPGTTLNSSPVAAAPGAVAPAQGQGTLPGFTPGSPAAKSMSDATKSFTSAGAAPEPQRFQLQPISGAGAAGGPMMLAPGGQNTQGQRLAQADLAQRMAQWGMAPPAIAGTSSFTPTMGMATPQGQQPMAQPGAATGMPMMPGTTLNSPSQLQIAMMSGSLDPYSMYARQPGS